MRAASRIVTLGCLVLMQAASSQAREDRPPPTKFIDALPATVYHLFQWPDDKVIEGEKRREANSPEVAFVRDYSAKWIKRVLDADWLPPKDIKEIYLRKEFNDRDTVRMQWRHDGYRIELSQTASVMAIKLTPLEKPGTGDDLDQRVRYAEQLSKRIFRDDGYMWQLNSQGPEPRIPVGKLKERIAAFSFDPAKTRELSADKVVIGFEKTIQGIGNMPAIDYAEDAKSEDPVAKARQAVYYWYRNIRWWNDGESVGFYFLKVDGPAAFVASYAAEVDVDWFRPPKKP